MSRFYVVKEKNAADFLVEKESFEGVKLIAETVAEDIREVTNQLPSIRAGIGACHLNGYRWEE